MSLNGISPIQAPEDTSVEVDLPTIEELERILSQLGSEGQKYGF